MRYLLIVVAAFASALLAHPAAAGERIALVMANAAYRSVPSLKNPPTDAALVAAALRKAGFTRIETVADGDKPAMERALRDFSARAESADVALVYYAGHGIETAGRNFLIPVDARLKRDRDTDFEAIALDNVIRATEGARMRLVVLDACRENPFAASMAREGQGRSIGRGLARVEPATDTLVVYAARAGAIAADGEGRNSPFAQALASRIVEPGLEISLLFRRVRDDVLKSTGGEQEPFTYGSLSGNAFYFVLPQGSNVTVTVDNRAQTEALLWQGALTANNKAAYDDYLARYPNGTFASVARANLARLQTAAVGVSKVRVPILPDAPPPGDAAWRLTPAERRNTAGSNIYARGIALSAHKRWGELRAAADAGDDDAALVYAAAMSRSSIENIKAARPYLQRAADHGQVLALFLLGHNLSAESGRVATPKPRQEQAQGEAVAMYRKALAAGSADAYCELGYRYSHGRGGLPRNETQKLSYYEKGAALGAAECMNSLGYHYRGKNDALAAQWFRKAAEAGLSRGMENWADALRKGKGVPVNASEAAMWDRKRVALMGSTN